MNKDFRAYTKEQARIMSCSLYKSNYRNIERAPKHAGYADRQAYSEKLEYQSSRMVMALKSMAISRFAWSWMPMGPFSLAVLDL